MSDSASNEVTMKDQFIEEKVGELHKQFSLETSGYDTPLIKQGDLAFESLEPIALFLRTALSEAYERGGKDRDDYWKAQEMGKSDDCYKHEELAYQMGRKEALEEVGVFFKDHYWDSLEPERLIVLKHINDCLDTLISKEK